MSEDCYYSELKVARDYACKKAGLDPVLSGWKTAVDKLGDENQALRDEVARLRTALEQAGDDICSEFCGAGPCHKKCMAVQAALTPQGGKGGAG